MQKIIAIMFVCLIASTGFAIDPCFQDIEYATVGDRPMMLDLYCPVETTDSPTPVVVWVHGGAWRSGSKESVPVIRWLDAGFAIASVDYRLTPEARFPAQLHDIKAAIRFLRANASTYGLDPHRLVIAGSSAGGHLAVLAGVTHGVEALEGDIGSAPDSDSGVRAIVSFYGASNLQSILAQSTKHGLSVRVPALQLLLGGQPSDKPDLAKLASPVAHVNRNDPPLWLIHGDADPQMPLRQSLELAESYKSAGLPVNLEVIANGKHGGKEFFTDSRLDRIAAQIRESVAAPQAD